MNRTLELGRKLWRVIRPHRFLYGLCFVIVAARLFLIDFLTAFLTRGVTAAASSLDLALLRQSLLSFALILLAFILVDSCSLYLLGVVVQRMVNGLKGRAFAHVMEAPLWRLESLGARRSEILSRINDDVAQVERLLRSELIRPVMSLFAGVGSIWCIWRVHPSLALYLLALSAITLGLQRACGRRQGRIAKETQEALADMLTGGNELLEHQLNLRILHCYDGIAAYLQKKLLGYSLVGERDARLQGAAGFVQTASSLLQYAGVMVISLLLLRRGRIAVADIPYVIQLSGTISMAFILAGSTVIALRRSMASFERVDALCALPREELDAGRRDVPLARGEALEIRPGKIRFSEDNSLEVTRTLRVTPRSITALHGPSGCGKSSLCKAVLGFYPYEGDILLGSEPVRDYSLRALRRSIAYVPQTSVIVRGTVRENLLLGCDGGLSPDAIRTAMEAAGCADWIDRLPRGLDTELAEGGMTLSGGQRQTLALARALLQPAPILLLDETFSGVSKARVERIFDALRANYAHKTILVVSHEQEIAAQCDGVFSFA